jgi:FlaA1/EpsC-like NDP-sugar epimerase
MERDYLKIDINLNLNMFKGKTLMITGGSGSFGNAILQQLNE